MQLPPHDTIRNEFQNTEDLTGTQASLEVIEPAKAQLWFAGRQLLPDKLLRDYLGKNEKCKVILKLTKAGEGPPGREAVFSEDQRRQMMLHAYRRQEELKVGLKIFIFIFIISMETLKTTTNDFKQFLFYSIYFVISQKYRFLIR
jgi:hypothetical protein